MWYENSDHRPHRDVLYTRFRCDNRDRLYFKHCLRRSSQYDAHHKGYNDIVVITSGSYIVAQSPTTISTRVSHGPWYNYVENRICVSSRNNVLRRYFEWKSKEPVHHPRTASWWPTQICLGKKMSPAYNYLLSKKIKNKNILNKSTYSTNNIIYMLYSMNKNIEKAYVKR